MKQNELKPCCCCGQGVMHGNQILSTRVLVTRMAANLPAIRRQHGLETMIAAALAFHMGTQEDLLKELGKEETLLVCDSCAMTTTIAELWEKAQESKP